MRKKIAIVASVFFAFRLLSCYAQSFDNGGRYRPTYIEQFRQGTASFDLHSEALDAAEVHLENLEKIVKSAHVSKKDKEIRQSIAYMKKSVFKSRLMLDSVKSSRNEIFVSYALKCIDYDLSYIENETRWIIENLREYP